MRVGNKPVGASSSAASPLQGRPRGKPARRNRIPVLFIIAVVLAIGSAAAIHNRTALNLSLPAFGKKQAEPVPQKVSGHIIIPHGNSDLCDRYQFDNKSGAMKQMETFNCLGREKVATPNQISNFSSSWRSTR